MYFYIRRTAGQLHRRLILLEKQLAVQLHIESHVL